MNLPDFRSPDEAYAYLSELETKIKAAKEQISGTNLTKFETLEQNFKRQDASAPLKFIPTGLFWLDNELANHGLAEGSFINLAGASFAGKTFFILTLLQKIAESDKAAFFSYEMYEKVLYRKLRFSRQTVRRNLFLIQDEPYLDAIELRIRTLVKTGVKFFAVDSRMKIQLREKTDEYIKNVTISATLSRLCRETGAIIILINQMNNADLSSGKLNLKGGNDQVYDSDMVFYVVLKDDGMRWLICEKDRLSDSGLKWKVKIPHITPNRYGAATAIEFKESEDE
ncbi:MAG: secretion system protein [Campylobacter sp.]|nr:secretion system protein [Campylobacter sp.]